jgi:predicted amidohydrolase
LTDQLIVAAVQPRVGTQPVDELARAADFVRRARAGDARLVLFPEAYPGPRRAGAWFEAADAMAEAAAAAGSAVCWSRVERSPAHPDHHQLVAYVHGADGRLLERYPRAHPATGDVHPRLSGTAISPGDRLSIFEVEGVAVGLAICSELWLPEVARVLAILGAEVILTPAGGRFTTVASNWQTIVRARAIENHCYVVMTHGLFGEEAGSALIAGPEADVVARTTPGVLVGRLDLARARWLRSRDDSMEEPKPFRSLPGLLRARRPALYGPLAEEGEGLYDYQAAASSGRPA